MQREPYRYVMDGFVSFRYVKIRGLKLSVCGPEDVGCEIREGVRGCSQTLGLIRVQAKSGGGPSELVVSRWNRDGATTGAVDHKSIAEQVIKAEVQGRAVDGELSPRPWRCLSANAV